MKSSQSPNPQIAKMKRKWRSKRNFTYNKNGTRKTIGRQNF